MAVVLIVLAVLGYLIAVYITCGVIFWYIGWFALIILSFVIITCAIKKTHTIHVHHYTIGMVLIVLVGY